MRQQQAPKTHQRWALLGTAGLLAIACGGVTGGSAGAGTGTLSLALSSTGQSGETYVLCEGLFEIHNEADFLQTIDARDHLDEREITVDLWSGNYEISLSDWEICRQTGRRLVPIEARLLSSPYQPFTIRNAQQTSVRFDFAVGDAIESGQLELSIGVVEEPSGTGGTGGSAGSAGFDDGYLSAGDWQGHCFTAVEHGSISPDCADDPDCFSGSGNQVCAAGDLLPDPDYAAFALLGCNLNQPYGGEPGSWSVDGFGMDLSLTNPGGSPLRVHCMDDSGNFWCADVREGQTGIAWESFNSQCWDNSGEPLLPGTSLTMCGILVPGTNTDSVPFDFCVDRMAPLPYDGP